MIGMKTTYKELPREGEQLLERTTIGPQVFREYFGIPSSGYLEILKDFAKEAERRGQSSFELSRLAQQRASYTPVGAGDVLRRERLQANVNIDPMSVFQSVQRMARQAKAEQILHMIFNAPPRQRVKSDLDYGTKQQIGEAFSAVGPFLSRVGVGAMKAGY